MDTPNDRISDLEMTVAVNGLTLSKQDAMRSLVDHKGNAIQFEEQKDGSLISKAVEGDNYTYTYSLVPQIQIVTVSVAKNPKKNVEEKKALQDAKTVAENAPDKQTQKEAEQLYKNR
jgi:hypothetical protein